MSKQSLRKSLRYLRNHYGPEQLTEAVAEVVTMSEEDHNIYVRDMLTLMAEEMKNVTYRCRRGDSQLRPADILTGIDAWREKLLELSKEL